MLQKHFWKSNLEINFKRGKTVFSKNMEWEKKFEEVL